jgi:vacuolar-type H+-ATPase subunit E/Vma4
MRAWGSADAVIAAVHDDAAVERERIEQETAAALTALARAAETGEDRHEAGSDVQLEAVRSAAVAAEAAEDWDDTVATAADRDAWILEIAAAGRLRIATDAAVQAWLERTIREAVTALPGSACSVTVPEEQLAAAQRGRAAIEAEVNRQITLEGGALTAGCHARTPDGRITFDNTLEGRERRRRLEWRAAVARIYDQAVAAVTMPQGVA